MASDKALELRALLGLAIALRGQAESMDDPGDVELFRAAAQALEDRANRLAFGMPEPAAGPAPCKVDILC
jgi:hypothetical protein